LANAINAELYQLYYKFKRKAYSPIKYPLLFIKTLSLLSRLRPRIIICQEPPAFCSAAAIAYHYFWNRKSRVVIDAHTAAFKPPWSYFKIPHKSLLNRAFLVVVTNDELRDTVMKQYGVRPFVLPDKIALMERSENTNDANPKGPRLTARTFPQITNDYDHHRNTNVSTGTETKGEHASKPISLGLRCFRMVVICSFSPDEPIAEVVQAAEMLPEIEFCVTGDYTRASGSLVEKITQNVVLTGYLNRIDYVALLRSADAIIALTKRDSTMLSGANEAFALSKPLITSGWPSLRNYFRNAAIYVSDRHTPEEIAEAVIEVASMRDELVKESEHLKDIRSKEWQERFEDFRAILMQDSELPSYFKRIPGNEQDSKSSAKDGKTSSSAA
jgi:glycosyltransferase involved in cell wall biosynthesis